MVFHDQCAADSTRTSGLMCFCLGLAVFEMQVQRVSQLRVEISRADGRYWVFGTEFPALVARKCMSSQR